MNYSLEDFQVPNKSKPRITYLVPYRQADRTKLPNRQNFGEAVANEFNLGDPKGKVAYWSCTLENHVNGGEHYHLSLKLTGPRRSFSVRNALQRLHKKHLGMLLDFRLDFQEHWKSLLKKVHKTVSLLCKFQNILPRSALLTIYKCFVRTHLDYGDIIYDF